MTTSALPRDRQGGKDFEQQLEELRSYFQPHKEAQERAIPGDGLKIPIYKYG